MPVLYALALGAGCGDRQPSSGPPPPPSSFQTVNPRDAGDALMARGDYAGAIVRYRAAIRKEPDDLAVVLGTAFSRLGETEETAQQFIWVLEHGRPDRQEVVLARQWLMEVGQLTPPTPAAAMPTPTPEPTPADVAAQKAPAVYGSLKGKIVWPGVEKAEHPLTLELRLNGEGANAVNTFRFRLGFGKPYTLPRLPAGPYRVVGRVGDVVLWDTRVVISPNAETVLDLSPEYSSADPARTPLPGAGSG